MKKWWAVVSVLALFAVATGRGQDKAGHGDDSGHVVARPDGLKWGPAPPALPPGAQVAVVAGEPGKSGSAFVLRVKLPDGYKVAPHWHPNDENVTVLKGTLLIGLARMRARMSQPATM